MFDWVVSFFSGWLGIPITGSAVRDVITRVINTFLSLFNGWIGWIGWFANRYLAIWASIGVFVTRLTDWAEYVILVRIPNAVTQAFINSTNWAANAVNGVRNFLLAQIQAVENRAQQLFAAVYNTAAGWVIDLRNFVSTLWGDFQAVKARVVALLTNPQVLADWITDAILTSVGRWFVAHAAALARLLLSNAVRDTEWLASLLEDIILRVLQP